MTFRESLEHFKDQFAWHPELQGGTLKEKAGPFVLCGMGGSALAGDVIHAWQPQFELLVHRDYGLPEEFADFPQFGGRIIVCSYSGNTEEVIDSFTKARALGFEVVTISSGGHLLDLAKKEKVPFIEIPESTIQPRMALGYLVQAVLLAMGALNALEVLREEMRNFDTIQYESQGKELAEKLHDRVPLIYASRRNQGLAYIWKIIFNETGKIPAFANRLPEANHNEITGFDPMESPRKLSEHMAAIFLRDEADHERIMRRMELTADLYRKNGLLVEIIQMKNIDLLKIFGVVALADWTAYYLAKYYGADPEQVLLQEEFKKKL